MPDLKEHEKQSMSKYNQPFTKLHQWMDYPSKGFGKRHRMFRHDPKTTPEEAKKLFGENADHACLDHIVIDLDEEYKIINHGKNVSSKTKMMSIRMPRNMIIKIKEYAAFSGNKVNPIIIALLEEGMHQKINVGTYKMWEESMILKNQTIASKYPTKMNNLNENPSILLERDKGCVKCQEQNKSKLNVYYIDRNPMNTSPSNIVMLCDCCKSKLETYTFKVHPIRKYIEWFLFS